MKIGLFSSRLNEVITTLEERYPKQIPTTLRAGSLTHAKGGRTEVAAVRLALNASLDATATNIVDCAAGTAIFTFNEDSAMSPQDYALRLSAVIGLLIKRKYADLPYDLEINPAVSSGGEDVAEIALMKALTEGREDSDEIIALAELL
jgi:hypothetical protein